MRRAFTMMELIFVIVILGILAGVAAPRLFATRDDAIITKTRADIASIRSAITNMRNTNMLAGNFGFPNLEGANSALFDNVLQNGIKPKEADDNSGWTAGANNTYTFTLRDATATFTYNIADGSFNCPNTNSLCRQLTE